MISPTAIISGVIVTAILIVALYFGTRPTPATELAFAGPAPAAVAATASRPDAGRR